MMRKSWRLAAGILAAALLLASSPADPRLKGGESPHKVYVILGFHSNFYHSWRGDTPDEAGFGTDIRVVREIIRMLDEANAQGLDARGYWEGENLFTFEEIIPQYAPDILEGIKRRIASGQDEFMLAPYSNTLFNAVTEDEMRATVRWAVSNPWGSGAKDLFGSYVPLLRPQEGMGTTGQNRILLEEGIEGVVFAYSTYSFTTFSNFVPALPPEQRYGLTWMKMKDDDQPILLFPCVSAADVVNFISLERWMLDLRKLQTSGKVNTDLVIHINFDADSETWLPLLPPPFSGIPNAGGLPEFIRYVNKYDWAEFALPSQFMAGREPVGEVMIRQDLADGGWDGNYSWAEKHPSHLIWTELEKSRLYTYQAAALFDQTPPALVEKANALLYDGRDSSFFKRIRGLSTTHFGMSTPLVNEERQAVAERVVGEARDYADQARRLLAEEVIENAVPDRTGRTLYSLLVRDLRPEWQNEPEGKALTLVRVPLILPDDPGPALELVDDSGHRPAFSLVNLEPMSDRRVAADLLVLFELEPGEQRRLRLRELRAGKETAEGDGGRSFRPERLANDWLELELDRQRGVSSLKLGESLIGDDDFLSPFITYRTGREPVSYHADGYEFVDLEGERWEGIKRSKLKTAIPFDTPHGAVRAELEFAFTLPEQAPWLMAEVKVSYPYTVKEDMLHNVIQKLRRWLDLRWIEVAPFQLHPRLEAAREDPIRVWKHNYLNVTSFYDMNYAKINPKNAEWDSMNHQVTAGWVAVTDKKRGLLIAEDAEVLSSFAFAPMRLREREGRQLLFINPFGSYHGKQADYSHLGGTGVGSEIANTVSSALNPNGPSFNGVTKRFTLLIAPYAGDRPPPELEAAAGNFFYPPAVVYLETPSGVEAAFKEDILDLIEQDKLAIARQRKGPLLAPRAFLVNPTESAADVVWDEPDDARIEGYKLEWRESGAEKWNAVSVPKASRHRVDGLENGKQYAFRLRAEGMGNQSPWTETLEVRIGPVKTAGITSAAGGVGADTVFKVIYYSLVHFLTTP